MKNLKGFSSSIVVAIDFIPKIGIERMLEIVEKHNLGVKIGLPFFIEIGKDKIADWLSSYNVYAIADFKLADIGYVMSLTAERLKNIGFSAIISHGFVGKKDALELLREKTIELGLDLYVVSAMSHKGAEEILNRTFEDILYIVREIKADGIIAPATMPEYIKKAKLLLGQRFKILSPGVGAQGAKPGEALKNGADCEIIGRLITLSDNPEERIIEIMRIHEGIR